MTRALLDTHALLWLIEGDARLGSAAKSVIETSSVPLFVSYATIWEIALKQSIGKLSLTLPLEEFVERRVLAEGISLLEIQIAHIVQSSRLELHHRDPFDRLLVAQCLIEEMSILSRDVQLDAYGVERVWG